MIQPIYVYGHQILEQQCIEIPHDSSTLSDMILDLWDTMRNAQGCGLSAPQIGLAYNVFIIDSKSVFQSIGKAFRNKYFEPDDNGISETFINAKLIRVSNEVWKAKEGCLSLPSLTREVNRPWKITVSYLNQNLEKQECEFTGLTARMILHELDHINGILLLTYLRPLSQKMLYFKLKSIKNGKVKVAYPIAKKQKIVIPFNG